MRINYRTQRLVSRAILESRIKRWFKAKRKISPPPSRLLSKLQSPRNGIHVTLDIEERKEFIGLIREMYKTRSIVEKYREHYSRRPRLFYKNVFGFPPRESQPVFIIWGPFNIHFIFKKNDLIAFWRKVRWGPGSGGFYPVGDTDIKIKDLRGLISFGRLERHLKETNDIVRHESVHSFENFILKRRPPCGSKSLLFFNIKSELNGYLHNFRSAKKKREMKMNEWARIGFGLEAADLIDEYLGYEETKKRIRNLKSKIRKAKSKKSKASLYNKLIMLKIRLEQKKKKRKKYLSLHLKTVNQVKKALVFMPVGVLQRIICETNYERLHKKIPETVRVYMKMRYEWYNGR